VAESIFSPKSGKLAEPSSDCNIEPSVPELYIELADDVEHVVVGLRLSCGLALGVQHADWHVPGASAISMRSSWLRKEIGGVRTLTS